MTNPAEPRPYIFLSYAHEDAEIVSRFAARLQADGFRIWIDEQGIRGGENYNAKIDEAIEDCSVFLAFLSTTYLTKPYCLHEYNQAIDDARNITAVCVDGVTRKHAHGLRYLFSTFAGYSIPGYGTGIANDADFETVYDDLVNIGMFRSLASYDGTDAMPTLSLPDGLRRRLQLHRNKIYSQNGNYRLQEIHAELFPDLQDADLGCVYRDENRTDASLSVYLRNDPTRNLLLLGDGGMGKTVSMLRVCESLLEQGIAAVYIPLHTIDFSTDTLNHYLERVVCGSQVFWRVLQMLARSPMEGQPNLVLLLDGVNEVPPSQLRRLLTGQLQREVLQLWDGVQVILSSRYDFRAAYDLESDFLCLQLQPLQQTQVHAYLEKCGLPPVTDERLLELLRNPLRLSLYANAEADRAVYERSPGIRLDTVPNTAGKIIGNFLQTQLFRAATGTSGSLPEHLVVLEYILPFLAWHMVQHDKFLLSDMEIEDLIYDLEDDDARYRWYCRLRLNTVLRQNNLGAYRWESVSLLNLATRGLHLLHPVDGDHFEFLHQSFRDYFAAYHLHNELLAVTARPERFTHLPPSLGARAYEPELLQYVSDITREDAAMPRLTEDGWFFPGKDEPLTPSKCSMAEQLLSLLRDQEGADIQTAVHNLMQVMAFGRERLLGNCDFSRLDLRGCRFNGCRFVLWHRDRSWPSRFDGAWMNREFLLEQGHEAYLQAVCTDGGSLLFSGDDSGCVRCYDLARRQWKFAVQPGQTPVLDLAWDPNRRRLAILYGDALFTLDPDDAVPAACSAPRSRSRGFRYVRFAADGSLQLSYDLEPLVFYSTDGQRLPSPLEEDAPARCAAWHPNGREFIRSMPLQMISSEVYDEAEGWQIHPALRQRIRPDPEVPYPTDHLLCLQADSPVPKVNLNSLTYSPDGSRFLVTIHRFLLEYDSRTMTLLRKKMLPSAARCACYGPDGTVIAGCTTGLYVLTAKLAETLALPNVQMATVSAVTPAPDGSGYYLFSRGGEIKQLDNDLQVCRQRRHPVLTGRSVWVRDRRTGELQMAFPPSQSYPLGFRFSFETGQTQPLGWCYESMEQDLSASSNDRQIYLLRTNLLVVQSRPVYRRMIFTNYSGIWIAGCSFRGIRGGLAQAENRQLLRQNGGITDA